MTQMNQKLMQKNSKITEIEEELSFMMAKVVNLEKSKKVFNEGFMSI